MRNVSKKGFIKDTGAKREGRSRVTKPAASSSSERPAKSGFASKRARFDSQTPAVDKPASPRNAGRFAKSGDQTSVGKKRIALSPRAKRVAGDVETDRKSVATSKPRAAKRTSDKIRINRFLSNSGVCSRREADRLIEAGCVTVNGKIVSELGVKLSLNDEVRFNGQLLTPERKVYLVLNKPKGFVTTTDDPQERKTVMDLVKNACDERIYPVGRLDKDTTGILLFTNDGDMAKKLTHPSFTKRKIYHVFLDKPLTKAHLLEITQGVELEDGPIAADAIDYSNEEDKREIGIEIHSGQNRVVRRIFEHFGYKVEKLDRVIFAGISKKNLPRGHWRFLTASEINVLKMM